MSEAPGAYFSGRRGKALLWIGLLLPPLAWMTALNASYVLASFECTPALRAATYGAAGVALVAALASAALAWRNWRRVGRGYPRGEEADLVVARTRFLALAGVLAGAWFSVVIVVQAIPAVLQGCS